jgi:hypothetical protein
MRERADFIGSRFGKLTVIAFSHTVNSRSICQCLCDCGNTVLVHKNHLTNKPAGTKSCGCLRKDVVRSRKTETPYKIIFADYVHGAKRRGVSFELTFDEVSRLIVADCYYCGNPPQSIYKRYNHNFSYNGIDRVDNDKGYTTDNVVTCCKECNRAKSVMSQQDYIDLCKRVAQRFS